MNKVSLVGRLTKDPELKFMQGSGAAVTNITIAIDEYDYKTKQKVANFISVVVWGKQAEALAQHMCKGGLISVVGKLRSRSYVAADGSKRYVTEVIADRNEGIKFLSKPASNNSGGNYNQGGYNQGGYNQGGYNQGGYNQGGYNQGTGYNQNGGYNQSTPQNQNNYSNNNQSGYSDSFGQTTESSPFDNAFGGFGEEFMPVDDGDIPF